MHCARWTTATDQLTVGRIMYFKWKMAGVRGSSRIDHRPSIRRTGLHYSIMHGYCTHCMPICLAGDWLLFNGQGRAMNKTWQTESVERGWECIPHHMAGSTGPNVGNANHCVITCVYCRTEPSQTWQQISNNTRLRFQNRFFLFFL